MVTTHNLGFPRIGKNRITKKTVESYWKNEISQEELISRGKKIKKDNWKLQSELDLIPVGDFSWYDHMLDLSHALGVIPDRFKKTNSLDTKFQMARGEGKNFACEMTKWFDTNYHYIVPELKKNQAFELNPEHYIEQINEAAKLNYNIKPVLVGPISYLWLSKTETSFDKLQLLQPITELYLQLFKEFKKHHINWVQIDEPVLGLDIETNWKNSFESVYHQFAGPVKILLTTYFTDVLNNLSTILNLPTAGIHIDLSDANQEQLPLILDGLHNYKILSCGIVNGRNIWKSDLNKSFNLLSNVKDRIQDRLWIAPSCSLLHVPLDLDDETKINKEIKSWLSFAKQKLNEISILSKALNNGIESVKEEFEENKKDIENRKTSSLINNINVQNRVKEINEEMFLRKNSIEERKKEQDRNFNLPLFPTTTIGSYPQTEEIRQVRRKYKNNQISEKEYEDFMQKEIKMVIKKQEEIGLDVLVHGEPERNDMVEYFGELLSGFTFTENGWVQSYGSRCVKPPIIYGDVQREKPMTVKWLKYAQSLTSKKVKGMLTGPVTILAWSFVRDDQDISTTAYQIGLSLRDEIKDLEENGINIIQVDEAAFRETLPLNKKQQPEYLKWAINSFKLCTSGVKIDTQIHSHMCYSEFNEMINYIADLNTDVISIESSRSKMELLEVFKDFKYPSQIGPGIYDIHSPRIPDESEMIELLDLAIQKIDKSKLWVNPDCGLKTRNWQEVEKSLTNLVKAAKQMRQKYA